MGCWRTPAGDTNRNDDRAGDMDGLHGGFAFASKRTLGNGRSGPWPAFGMPVMVDGKFKLMRNGWGLISFGTTSVRRTLTQP